MRLPPWDEWYAKEYIKGHGLPVTLRVVYLGDLLALDVIPSEGFVHLALPDFQEESFRRFGPYHVSICFRWDINDFNAHHVPLVVDRWDGWRGVLGVGYVSMDVGKGYVELDSQGALRNCPHLMTLFRGGSYGYKELHISM